MQPPDLSSLSPDEIRRFVEEHLEDDRRESLEKRWRGIPEKARLWLALAPSVTAELARAIDLPIGKRDPGETLASLESRGLMQARRPSYLQDQNERVVLYTMDDAARESVLEPFTDPARSPELLSSISELGRKISELGSKVPGLPSRVSRWAQMAAQADSVAKLVETFDEEVDRADAEQDTGGLLRWIEVARPLVDVMGLTQDATLDVAVHRAGRRLELLHRERQDERHLATFLERDEQIAAIRSLVEGPDDRWALHLIGSGGVGKTMLLRFLTGRLAPKMLAEHKIPTARIDFDYLNADYPQRSPGLLLWSFGQELRRFDDGESATMLFNRADEMLRDLHKRLGSSDNEPSESPTRDSRFVDAVRLYIDGMRSLPQPVILILDTCEELAKIRPDGTVPESVSETFRILEALHDGPETLRGGSPSSNEGLPSLRVVFAGRRPLASRGVDWTCKSYRPQHADTGEDYEEDGHQHERCYLRLHELRGFTRTEAGSYLREKAGVPADLIDPIIDRNPDTSTTTGIEWDEESLAPSDEPRYNPYDLKLYADWAKEQPPPDAETIRHSTAAQYVELRILQRINFKPLEDFIPALTLLKHVDRELVQATGVFDDVTTDRVFEQLWHQEWIDARQVSSEEGEKTRRVLTVKEGLRRRLWHYFHERGGVPRETIHRAAQHLMQRTINDPLSELDWSEFDAALRALEAEPKRAADWWRQVERRIVDERGYGWLRDITGSLQAEDNAAGQPHSPESPDAPPVSRLRPAVLASYAAGLLRANAETELEGVWSEILDTAERHPDAETAERLRLRALAGLVAHQARQGGPPAAELAAAFWATWPEATRAGQAMTPQRCASLLAAIEPLIEYAEAYLSDDVEALGRVLAVDGDAGGAATLAQMLASHRDHWLEMSPTMPVSAYDALLASALVAAGRERLLMGDRASAAKNFEAALRRVDSRKSSAEPGRWDDWVSPEDVTARVHLEGLRGLSALGRSLADLLERVGEVPLPLQSVDAERLFAARMRVEAAMRPPSVSKAYDAVGWQKSGGVPPQISPPRPPRCLAHRWAPPPFVVAAEAAEANGNPDDALKVLRFASSNPSMFELDDLRHAERVLLEIALRWRLGDEDAASVSLERSKLADRELVLALRQFAANRGEVVVPKRDGGRADDPLWRDAAIDSAWRTACFLFLNKPQIVKYVRTLLATRDKVSRSEPVDPVDASMRLNNAEAALLAGEPDKAKAWIRASDNEAATLAASRRLVLAQRRFALEQAAESSEPALAVDHDFSEEFVDAVGPRRAAMISLFEGDLLALRLPTAASHLYARAYSGFVKCEDSVGSFLAVARIGLIASAVAPSSAQAALRTVIRAVNDVGRSVDSNLANWNWNEPTRPPDASTLPQMLELSTIRSKPWRAMLWRVNLSFTLPLRPPAGSTPAPPFETSAEDIESADVAWAIRQHSPGIVSGSAVPPEKTVSAARSRMPAVKQVFQVALGLAMLAGAFAVSFWLFRWAVFTLPGIEGFSTTTQVWIYVATLFLFGALGPAAFKQWRSVRAALTRFTIRVKSQSDGGSATNLVPENRDVPVQIELTVAVPRIAWSWLPRFRYAISSPIEAAGRTADLQPYRQLAESIDADLSAQLRKIANDLGKRQARMWLKADQTVIGPCWEAMLQLAAKPDWQSGARLPLACGRTISSRETRNYLPTFSLGSASVAVIASDDRAQQMVRALWLELIERNIAHVMTDWQEGLSSSESSVIDGVPSFRVLHLVGSVEEGSAGLRLRAGRVGTTKLASEGSYAAQDVTRRFPELGMCILQGEAISELDKRLSSNRLTAMFSRRFAAEIHLLGVPIVLVIPPLTPEIAARALAPIVELVGSGKKASADRLFSAVGDVQAEILRRLGTADELWEIGLDMCLYLTDAMFPESEIS